MLNKMPINSEIYRVFVLRSTVTAKIHVARNENTALIMLSINFILFVTSFKFSCEKLFCFKPYTKDIVHINNPMFLQIIQKSADYLVIILLWFHCYVPHKKY